MNNTQLLSDAPFLSFRYVFKFPFFATAKGYLQKYDCEKFVSLSTWNEISQLDEDTVVFVRKHELISDNTFMYERMILNRKT